MTDDLVTRLLEHHEAMRGPDYYQAATALTEARAEIERLREQVFELEHGVEDQMEEAAYHAKQRAAAEAELSTLRARVREVVVPFARADRAIGSEPGPFRFETGTGHRLIERGDLAAASRFMEELK